MEFSAYKAVSYILYKGIYPSCILWTKLNDVGRLQVNNHSCMITGTSNYCWCFLANEFHALVTVDRMYVIDRVQEFGISFNW